MNNKLYLLIIFIFVWMIFLVSGSSSSGKISWDYHGSWYSKGFVEYVGWKNFMDLFMSTVLGLQVIDVNGKVGLKLITSEGIESINTNLVSFDKKTGKLSYSINLSLPLIGFKNILYNISLNNEKDINKVVDTDYLYNKTIEEILLELSRRGVKISLICEKSNITLVPNGTGKYEIIYLKNIYENDTRLIIEASSNYSVVNNTTGVNESSNEDIIENKTIINNFVIDSKDINLKILNPRPSNYNFYGYVGETKIFSIDNDDYDKLRWLLDGKLVKENSNFYDFYALKDGKFSVKVIVKKANITKTNIWNVVIGKKSEETGSENTILYSIIILVLVTIVATVIYILFRKKSEN